MESDGPRCVIAHPALLRWQSDPSATTTEPPLVGSNASQCCDHRLCHHECLLKLEVCVIRFGRVEPWEIVRWLARDCLNNWWYVDARFLIPVGCATSVLQRMV